MKPEPEANNPQRESALPSATLLCRSLLGQIDIRRRDAQRELKAAIENKEWSKVAGWDGIDIGLMMAEKTIKDEMRHNAQAEPRRESEHKS